MSYQAPNLPLDKHCFFGSQGGVSSGIYESLNVSLKSDDKPENVWQNLEIAASELGLHKENLLLLTQGVSNKSVFVREASQWGIEADGAVTDKSGIGLCIRTADCAPVLMGDFENGVIGAAHAGWRGAFKGIIENTLDLMIAKGAKLKNIRAAVGPCIGQKSYEVDESFYRQFIGVDTGCVKYFINADKPEHYLFNLEAFCTDKLRSYGVKSVTASGLDTYALDKDYFSFRRNTHRHLIHAPKCFPVELSAICL